METKKQMIYVEELVLAIRDDLEINSSNFARVMDHINEAKTVDAVEVVRCRECTKARKEIALDNREYFTCKHTECCHGGDHFCSCGERRCDNEVD